jgi:hypothetical protein
MEKTRKEEKGKELTIETSDKSTAVNDIIRQTASNWWDPERQVCYIVSK